MATAERFEDLDVWAKARRLTKVIYEVTEKSEFARDYGLRDQLRRAAVSVMSNVAEGFERQGDKEFRHFLSLAKGSAGEVRSHLFVALDVGMIEDEQIQYLQKQSEELSRMLSGLIWYLQKSDAEKSAKSKA